MARRVVHVLLQTGSKEEAAAARRAFGDGITLHFGLASAHTAGQPLYGDVVVLGPGAKSVDQDASGTVSRYKDLNALLRSAVPPEPAQPKADEYGAPQPEPAPEPEPDPTEGMDRVGLIQYAAAKWPGERRWAIMPTDDLKATIREMEAGD